jgi:hypothetical protein
MAGLARLCIRRKNLVLFAWIAMLAALGWRWAGWWG